MLTQLRTHRLHMVEPNAARSLLAGVSGLELEAAMDAEPEIVREVREVSLRQAEGVDAPGTAVSVQVAILPVQGYLLPSNLAHPLGLFTGYDWITGNLRALAASGEVDAIVLDISSPGGTQVGALEAAEIIAEVSESGVPVYARVADRAFSAAYWLASATRGIYAAETAQVGSIGVLAMHFEYSEALAQEGIKATIFRAGSKKAAGNPYEPLDEEFAAELQVNIEKWFQIFAERVAAARNLDVEHVKGFESRVFDADEGERLGLVDAVLRPDKALVAIMEEAAMSKQNAVVEERRRVASILAHEAAASWPKTAAKLVEAGVSAEAALELWEAIMADFGQRKAALETEVQKAASPAGFGSAFEQFMAKAAKPIDEVAPATEEVSEADLMRSAYQTLVGEGQKQ